MHSAYHAFDLVSKGRDVSALYTFLKVIIKYICELKPEFVAAVYDSKPVFRTNIYPDYKANRTKIPDELLEQINESKLLLENLKITHFEKNGHEADDVIYSIVKKVYDEVDEVFIVSNDKDMLQLVDTKVKVIKHGRWGGVIDVDYVKKKYSVEPHMLADFFAIVGDPTDNIPGVKGIGEKGAARIINSGRLDELLDNPDFLRSKELVRLYYLDIDFKLDDLKLNRKIDREFTQAISKYGFTSILKELSSGGFEILKEEVIETALKTYKELNKLKLPQVISVYLYSPDDYIRADSCILYFAFEKNRVYRIGDMKLIKAFLENLKGVKLIGHNVKKDLILAKRLFGVELKDFIFDTSIAAWVIDPSIKTMTLKDIVLTHFGVSHDIEGMLTGYIGELMSKLSYEISSRKLDMPYYEIEMPLIEVVASMEYEGVYVDRDKLLEAGREFYRRMEDLKVSMFKIVGYSFNPDSPKQVSEVLFKKLGLKAIKKTKTGYSTDEEVLEKLSRVHPVPGLLFEYRELSKLYNTYIEGLLKLIHPKTNRIHARFNQAGTETGRFSSSDPNLQNIPARGAGLKIREAFRASQGKILKADYSQIEPRLLAHFSQDPKLIEFFTSGGDVHASTAIALFGKVDDTTRRAAKTINFGIMYGMQPQSLAEVLGVDFNTAKNFIDSYYENFPRVKIFKEEVIEFARKNGYVETILGRRRYIPHINSIEPKERAHAERIAVNTVLQGSAADVVKYAMIKIFSKLKEKNLKSKLCIQVHDELVFEVDPQELESVKEIVLTSAGFEGLKVPLEVNIKVSDTWA